MGSKPSPGYKPYSYLEAGVDYVAFALDKELERVAPDWIELSEGEEQRLAGLLDGNLVVSVHDHPCINPASPDKILEYSRAGRWCTGYRGLAASGLDVVFDGMMGGLTMVTSKAGWAYEDVIIDLGMRFADLAHQDLVYKAETIDDLLAAKPRQRIALVACVESTTPIETDLDRLDVLYGLGVRVMGLTYNEANCCGAGRRDKDAGLTAFGRRAVKRMNQLGLAIDLSHTGDRTSLDAIEVSKVPLLITHGGARALIADELAAQGIMKSDEVLKACATRGGLVGITMNPYATATKSRPRQSIESIMEHVEYCVDLLGIDAVALGPDTCFGDHVAAYRAFGFQVPRTRDGKPALEEIDYVRGAESPETAVRNAARWMVKHGWSDDDIVKVIGGNAIRVLRQIWCR
jgi:membrane dipeptidase